MATTKSQEWARNLSKRLENSYDSSALIEHKVTSGNNRETQILDILRVILPKKYPLLNNVVIINSQDNETIKFDGAIVDDQNWPRLFADENLIVAPIESIKIVFEIKSNFGKTEVDKIYQEAQNLSGKARAKKENQPKVVGFCYKCSNIKLAYFDFVSNYLNPSNDHPSLICILNVGILCFLQKDGSISKAPNSEYLPILLETNEDSLLVFMYLLTEYLCEGQIASTIRRYSSHIYKEMPYFGFEDFFINELKSNPGKLRDFFKGDLDADIRNSYQLAKNSLQ